MTQFKNARLNDLAKQQAEHNLNVLGNLSTRFANLINSELEFESQKKALRALKLFDKAVLISLKALINNLKTDYHAANAWTTGTFTHGKGQITNYYAKQPLSQQWIAEKHRRIRAHNKRKDQDTNKIRLSDELTRLSNHNPFALTHFHGLGYFGVQPEKKNPITQSSLKKWVAQLDLTTDVDKLYAFLGRARLTVTGPLATRKGFQQLNNAFYTDSGHYDTLEEKLKHEKKVTQKRALKQKAPYRSSVTDKKGLYLHVETGKTPYAFLKGRRVSLLDLNRAGLIGSRLTIAAFHHVYRDMDTVNQNVRSRYPREQLFEYAKRNATTDIFGSVAGTKLWFSATKKRTPINNALDYVVGEVVPFTFRKLLKDTHG